MKTTHWVLVILTGMLLAFTGCGSKNSAPPDAVEINGVKVHMPKLQEAFASAPPEVQSDVTQVGFGLRYGQYMNSLAALDKLANNASTTAEQKKVVNDLIEEVKQVISKAPPPTQ